MALKDSRQDYTPSVAIPDYPKLCGKFDCNDETAVAILSVRREDGKIINGAFGQYAYEKRSGDNVMRQMKSGYTFNRWITRCAKCYEEDQHR